MDGLAEVYLGVIAVAVVYLGVAVVVFVCVPSEAILGEVGKKYKSFKDRIMLSLLWPIVILIKP